MHEAVVSEFSSFQVYFALGVFLITYAFIVSEKINRAVAALLGSLVLVFAGILDYHKALTEHVEWGTISLLIGMMILVGITNKTGVFQYVAIKSVKFAKGEPIKILLILSALTALGSAFLDNVTTVLLVAPVTISIAKMLKVNPLPFLISEIIFSNIGGTATLIGDPPNIMIGSANKHLTFNDFLFNLGPIVAVILVVVLGIIYFLYRKQLKVSDEVKQEVMKIDENDYITDRKLMKKSLVVLAATIVGFATHSIFGVEAAAIAMMGATVLMLIGLTEHDMEEALNGVEWITIFFFVGLFSLVGALIDVGLIGKLAEYVLDVTGGDIGFAAILILWVSGIASGVIDNIPFVATMIPMIQDMAVGMGLTPESPEIDVLWWSLALGACLGGNGTLIGASANVVVAAIAEKEGHHITYWKFLKIGFPIMLVTLAIATGYVYFFLL